MAQSSYNSAQKSELYALLMVLLDFPHSLNIVTGSQYAERLVLIYYIYVSTIFKVFYL